MKKILLTLLSIAFLLACSEKEKTVEEVLNEVSEIYSEHNSISYNVDFRTKYINIDDTIQVIGSCKLIRDSSDTLFGGIISYETNDSIGVYYNLEKIYSINHKELKITEYDTPFNQKWAITGSTRGDLIQVPFFETQFFLKLTEDTTNKFLIENDMIHNKEHWKITCMFPDGEQFTETEQIFWINKDKYQINKISGRIKYQGNYQYQEWVLKDIEFDKVKKNDIDSEFNKLMKCYKIETYTETDSDDPELLENGSIAPLFSGEKYLSGKTINLQDFKDKIVILDFWFMACHWCNEAIPHLNELFNKYKDKGVVFLGVNSIDIKEKDRKKIPVFLKYNEMNYPIIFIDHKTDSIYHVSGYPTIYLIDRKGKIVFSQAGFSEDLKDTLEVYIKKLIN
ncbi:TlpA disulfide reductase family protein [Bacteroidota bacterium]